MIRNYIKVALRSILHNKLTAFINIAGLALAIACAILIFLFVTDEISYDRYHAKADRIYRVTRSFHSPEGEVNLHLANVAPPIGPLLKNDFGEIEKMARTINFVMVIGLEENGELKKSNNEEFVFLAEPAIFDIFDIQIKSGDAYKALQRPFTIMLSEKAAQKYFNSENIIGKRLRADNRFDLEITGVYKNFPAQSHWHPEFLVSFNSLEDDRVYGRNGLETNWGNNSFGTYLLLQQGADPKKVEASFPSFLDKHFGSYARANWGVPADWVASKTTTLFLQKLTDIHLRSHLDDELEANGNINSVYMMSIIGFFIVLIACFNFVNLSTARATKRAREVGLRKVVGALRAQLIGQYLSESILISFFSLMLAMLLSARGITWLNNFTGKAIPANILTNLPLLGGLILFACILGILAGIYPALVISSFNPVTTLKGQPGSSGKAGIRKTLVVVQFAISIILIIATLITFQQLSFLNTRELGYQKDQVITLDYYGDDLKNSYEAFYNALTQSSGIQHVGRSTRIPTGRLLDSYGSASVMKGDSLVNVNADLKSISIDEDFFDTYGIQLAAGRKFSKAIPTDDSLAFIINEAAAKAIGWTNLEENIDKEFHYADVNGKLIGIVKDFHFESLHQQIVPMIFLMRGNYRRLSVKISGKDMKPGLAHLEKTWKAFLPGKPFEYTFLSERYRKLYEAEQKQSQLFTTFAGLAIFIASMGLFGLATFNTLQRMKEIGIRKVLGASVGSILQLLSKEILILVGIANLIAWPVAWYFMNQWLNSFAYRVNMNIALYIAGTACAIAIALLTVSTQTIRAALRNPAKTLRYE